MNDENIVHVVHVVVMKEVIKNPIIGLKWEVEVMNGIFFKFCKVYLHFGQLAPAQDKLPNLESYCRLCVLR